MENIKAYINKKHYSYIALVIGITSMLFIGQEKQYAIFAWIAPIFLLQFTRKAKPIQFLLLFGLLVFAGNVTHKTHNLFNDPVYAVISGIMYALIFSSKYIIDRVLYQKYRGFFFTLVFPIAYTSVEILMTLKLGTSGTLAHTQFAFKPLIQLTTITGVHGIAFLICWFASIVYWITENEFGAKTVKTGLITFGIVFSGILGFGITRIITQPQVSQTVKVATITGPFDLHALAKKETDMLMHLSKNPQTKIPNSFYSSDDDITKQISHTKKAADKGAKIIIWNEAALFLNQKQLKHVLTQIQSIARKYKTYIVIAFYEENLSEGDKPLNNKSVLITKDGTIEWQYKKSYPTPVELPLVNAGNSIIPTYNTEYGKIGNVICYDYDFPSLLQQANKSDVDIMLVPAYDWEGFAHMHSKMANLETLQSGINMVRSNSIKGINSIVDGYGNTVSELVSFKSKERILYGNLPLNKITTLYSRIGNSFSILCFTILIVITVLRIIKRVK